ncbi:MAG: response regulator [Nitrospirae bacterium]|jgi:two-component system, NarL family, sensor histidine kinase UhpB|nr:response regulator [Nitrospirota bacterium]
MFEPELGRLLVVDDEIEILTLVCNLLTRFGYSVNGYTSGREALEALKVKKFDLLLTDLVMSDIDGITMLRSAMEIDPNIVGIIMTGKGTIQTAVDAMKAGAFDYIFKPLNLKILKQVLLRAMEVRLLRETEKKYRSIFENALGGIYQSTPEGRCITANPSLARILGYGTHEELINNITDMGQLYVNPKRRLEFIQMIEKNDIVCGFESQVYRKDGGRIWVSENARAVRDSSGRLLYYEGIVEDITERKRAEEELKNSREQLRCLSAYLHSAIEKERMYIAREIHDELGQFLTALKMDLFCLNNKISSGNKPVLTKIKSMSELVDIAVKTVQRVSAELRPRLLDDLGLLAAIEWQLAEFQKRTGIKCELNLNFSGDSGEIELSQDISTAVYRILQEALTNIVRHANATTVMVSLNEDADKVILEVRDNGRGITEDQISNAKSYGLTGIRERVYLLGGEVEIIGILHEGTTLKVRIPFDKKCLIQG